MAETNNRSQKTKDLNPTPRADKSRPAGRYNNDMVYDAKSLKQNIGMRLTELRLRRNVSAREMSISMGRGAGYINSIEGGHVLPSVPMIFEICDYLGVSVKEFFEFTEPETDKLFELKLTDIYRSLDTSEKQILRRIIELLERRNQG